MMNVLHYSGRVLLLVALLLGAASGAALAQQAGPDTLFRNGLTHFTAGKYEEAAKLFQELLANFGTEPSLKAELEGAYYALGCSLYNLGRYEESVETFTAYLNLYPAARFRDEVLFRIGAAQQALEAYDKALEFYQQLIAQFPRSPFTEDAAFQRGACYLLKSDFVRAASAFEQFAAEYPASDLFGQAKMFQARALFSAGERGRAVDALADLEGRGRRLGHIVYANFLAFEIGDAAFEDTDYELALRAYRRVLTRESLLSIQRRVVNSLQAEIEVFQKERPDPGNLTARFRRERRLSSDLQQARDLLQKLEVLPDYDAGLFHRIGRCFFSIDRYWEARVAFQRAVDTATEEKLRETAHFDLILVISRQRRFEDLIAEADRYLAIYE